MFCWTGGARPFFLGNESIVLRKSSTIEISDVMISEKVAFPHHPKNGLWAPQHSCVTTADECSSIAWYTHWVLGYSSKKRGKAVFYHRF